MPPSPVNVLNKRMKSAIALLNKAIEGVEKHAVGRVLPYLEENRRPPLLFYSN